MSLELHAAEFAKLAHGDQVRKYTGEPYWHHLMRVASLVGQQTVDQEVIAAAWLHDVLEDTETSVWEITRSFGARVAIIVQELTDVYTPAAYPNLNRWERKTLEAVRLGNTSRSARLIKRADIEDNSRDIHFFDPKFAAIYLMEKDFLLEQIA